MASRNAREGRYIGHAKGKAVRRIKRLFRYRVKSALARAYLRSREYRRGYKVMARERRLRSVLRSLPPDPGVTINGGVVTVNLGEPCP